MGRTQIEGAKENMDLRGRKCQETGEDCIMRSFITCVPFTKYYMGNEIKDKLGRTCSMQGEMRNMYKIFIGKPETFF
jgi:hypothetical protein